MLDRLKFLFYNLAIFFFTVFEFKFWLENFQISKFKTRPKNNKSHSKNPDIKTPLVAKNDVAKMRFDVRVLRMTPII